MPILEMNTATRAPKKATNGLPNFPAALSGFAAAGVAQAALDQAMADGNGVETFDRLFQAVPRVPILILRGAYAAEKARKIVRRGAQSARSRIRATDFA